jgi:hypothetical protein
MNKFYSGLAVGIIGTAIVGGVAFFLMPVQAHGLTKDQQAIFDYTKLKCKNDAKAKGFELLAKRKYVANCIMDDLQGHPDIDGFDID